MIRDLRKNGKWVTVEESQDFTNSPIAIIDGKLYLYTSVGAPRNRFVLVDPAKPTSKDWTEIIPEDPEGGVLTSVQFAAPTILWQCSTVMPQTTHTSIPKPVRWCAR